MRTFLVSFSILFNLSASAQTDSILTIVFQIPADRAGYFYQTLDAKPESGDFIAPVDSFYTVRAEQKRLPGHYLYLRPEGEYLSVEIRSYNRHQAFPLNDERDLALQVSEESGKLLDTASLRIGKKKMPFDPKTKAYRLKRHGAGGFLRVETPGDTLFFNVSGNEYRSLFRRRLGYFTGTRVGRFASAPVRWPVNAYKYFRRGFGWGDWRFYRWPIYSDRYREFQGYIAFSKPRYRPGDTLKVKAYITSPKGKPVNRPMKMTLTTYSTRLTQVLDTILNPVEKGGFVFEWPLSDTLLLDKRYNVEFNYPRNNRYEEFDQYFYLEDYELEEVFYELNLEKTAYPAGQPIRVRISGKDANGMPVPDGEAILTLSVDRIQNFYGQEYFLPDTIWRHRQDLGSSGEASVLIPDSILPPADLSLSLQAVFLRTDGQMETRSETIQYNGNPEQIKLALDGPFLTGEYLVDGKATVASGILIRSLSDPISITLPFRIPINPLSEKYTCQAGTAVSSIDLYSADHPANVLVTAQWIKDSVFVRVENPRRLPVTWLLRSAAQELGREITRDSSKLTGIKTGNSGLAELTWSYPWGGRDQTGNATVQPYKRLLTFEVEQPAEVWPGQTGQVKVKVMDYKGRPAQKVNLAVGAINAQFKDEHPYRAPEIRYPRKKHPFDYNTFNVEEKNEGKPFAQLPIRKEWYRRFGLDQQLYYRLRHHNQGVMLHYETFHHDPVYREVAQFAPYIVKKGIAQPVILIYCNRELVYFYGTGGNRPFSFAGQAGLNTIVVRTKDAEYTIDSVLLKKGSKLELSIDELHFGRGPMANQIRVKTMPEELTDAEVALLRNSIFVLRNQRPGTILAVWDQPWNTYITVNSGYKNQDIQLGPFKNGALLKMVVQDGDSTSFEFEPGFSYAVSKNRERLYQYDLFTSKKSRDLVSIVARSYIPRQTLLHPGHFPRKSRKSLNLPYTSSMEKPEPGKGRLFLQYPHSDSSLIALVVMHPDQKNRLYRYGTRELDWLAPGEYQVIAITANGYLAEEKIQIRANIRTLHRLSFGPFLKDEKKRDYLLLGMDVTPSPDNWGKSLEFKPAMPGVGPGRWVTGVILDDTGEPLIGASVLVKGTSTGTVTDIDGRYEVWVPAWGGELVVSYTGFSTREVGISGNRAGADVVLSGGVQLSEVVVTWLGVQRIKNDLAFSTSTLAGSAQGVDIRGSRSAPTDYYIDGIRVNNKLHPQQDSYNLEMPAGTLGIRSQFSDNAFWRPNLLTDANGEAWFTARFPDNITAWNTYALGMDRRGRAGIGGGQTRAVKPLQAQLSLPRFLVEGDRSTAIGRTLNFTGDTLQVATFFEQDGQKLDQDNRRLTDYRVDSLQLTAETGADSLHLTYGLEMGDYLDGEKRSIPVFPLGLEETQGGFYLLEGDTSFTFRPQPGRGQVKVYAGDNVLSLLLQDLDYLRKYPYGCNEQNASRLIALLLEKELRGYLGHKFDGEPEIRAMITRLKKTQRPDGSWGWWADGEGRIWVSVHVLKALYKAAGAGYKTDALEVGLRWLLSVLPRLEKKDQLAALDLLSALDQPFDYAPYLATLDTVEWPLEGRLTLIAIQQRMGLPLSMDTLDKYRHPTLMGGLYWDDNVEPGFWGAQNRLSNTLLAHEILMKAGRKEDAKKARQYFLENRGQGLPGGRYGWHNTLYTAKVLQTVLPVLMDGQPDTDALKNTLIIDGRKIEKFPLEMDLETDRPVQLSKTGAGPLFLTLYQQFWQTDPQPKTDVFEITALLKQNNQITNALEKGLPATLEVTLTLKADADHVLIEAPIPAGCSYGPKTPNRQRHEVYREYNRQAAAIFCEHLPAGSHTFTLALEPRFSGNYTINPAKAEQMYFPVLHGRNATRRINIHP